MGTDIVSYTVSTCACAAAGTSIRKSRDVPRARRLTPYISPDRPLSNPPEARASEEVLPAAALFVMIGAVPRTDWLPEEIARDPSGFVLTGGDVPPARWPLERTPLALETSMPAVFAAGDVRHGSIKRVASAAGEGSIAIQAAHALAGPGYA